MESTIATESYEQRVERTGGYPLYVAHRAGGGSLGPENTVYVGQQSLLQRCGTNLDDDKKRVRMLEVDVRLTKDRQLVLMHDSSVDRTTNGQGSVDQYNLRELQQLDAAARYPSLTTLGIRVPTLQEFLDAFVAQEPDLLFMFDFKDEDSIELALPLIEGYPGLQNRYILGSVFASPNALLRELRVDDSVQVVTDIGETIAMTMAHRTGLWSLHQFGEHDIFGYVLQSHSGLFFTQQLIEDLHAKGMRVMACGFLMADKEVRGFCEQCHVDYLMVEQLHCDDK
jgi:glycerophosphoryl diester phosphodiesterase